MAVSREEKWQPTILRLIYHPPLGKWTVLVLKLTFLKKVINGNYFLGSFSGEVVIKVQKNPPLSLSQYAWFMKPHQGHVVGLVRGSICEEKSIILMTYSLNTHLALSLCLQN